MRTVHLLNGIYYKSCSSVADSSKSAAKMPIGKRLLLMIDFPKAATPWQLLMTDSTKAAANGRQLNVLMAESTKTAAYGRQYKSYN